jgi:hypothetical protein
MQRVRKRPFVPFRLVLSTGQTYEVCHPDLIMVGRQALMIGTPSVEDPSLAEQVTRVALAQVTEVQDLPPPSAGNGPA